MRSTIRTLRRSAPTFKPAISANSLEQGAPARYSSVCGWPSDMQDDYASGSGIQNAKRKFNWITRAPRVLVKFPKAELVRLDCRPLRFVWLSEFNIWASILPVTFSVKLKCFEVVRSRFHHPTLNKALRPMLPGRMGAPLCAPIGTVAN